MTPTYGSVWSTTYIDASPIPVVSRDLLPWLKKDRREAEVGAMVRATNKDGKTETTHNKEGLEHAERELRRIQSDLASERSDTDRAAILRWQAEGMQDRVEFWRGKMYLLDKIIASVS
jgi:hypothetical protein